MSKSSAYSITVDAELNLANIQKQLDGVGAKLKVGTDTSKAQKPAKDMGLTFQEANMIMQASAGALSSMTEQVFELDKAMTEFKKVSDLSGSSLDSYVSNLSQMGKDVARTG